MEPVCPVSTNLQVIAATQLAAIRDALYLLGKPATPAEISELTALSLEIVSRRLKQAGPGTLRPEWRRFNFDRLSGRWSLTAGARQEAESARKVRS
jgi:hypothetical protein